MSEATVEVAVVAVVVEVALAVPDMAVELGAEAEVDTVPAEATEVAAGVGAVVEEVAVELPEGTVPVVALERVVVTERVEEKGEDTAAVVAEEAEVEAVPEESMEVGMAVEVGPAVGLGTEVPEEEALGAVEGTEGAAVEAPEGMVVVKVVELGMVVDMKGMFLKSKQY